ncbi:MerR family transcriptional regulator [Saccharothrix xinjiangensis]|uniref:MerR family transcriptional regulator n=1 Tax=Saccharothrix xinjiangensis TaxID=204798 RepID=A0ABV9YED9_9PSEU
MERLLGTGEFARRSRLSVKALRLYERQGLLRPARVNGVNGYRGYREDQLTGARLVALLRRLDMPLTEVARIAAAPEPDRAGLLAAYWAGVEERIAVQRSLAAHLRVVLSSGEGLLEMYRVEQREVPERVILTEQRHLLQPELEDWILTSWERMRKAAEPYGGASAPPYVIYHGEVNEDSNGPAEVCYPIDAASAPPEVASRVEPAHTEAYVRLRKAQVVYPQILSAFDAVARWAEENGRTVVAAPREVYFGDWASSGAEDEVCDVAFPVA